MGEACHMTGSFENFRAQHDEMVGSSGSWSTEETKALLDVCSADNIQSQLDGVV